MNFTPESLTLISIGVGIFATLISLRISMREWRNEHREETKEWRKEHKEAIQKMDDKINLMDAKWERLITLFITQANEKQHNQPAQKSSWS